MNVLVTGSNGFVGRALCRALEDGGHHVLRVVRKSNDPEVLAVGEIHGATDWDEPLSSPIDAAVHLAARVHVMSSQSGEDDGSYHAVNTLGTLHFAQQCANRGVKRFIFISSVKVLGEGRGTPYRADDAPCPEGGYAESKWKAEQGLHEIAARTGLEVVILRPPLVYGPGVGANFLALMRMVAKRIPLPLKSINNRRSFLYLDNLVECIALSLTHPAAAGKTYCVSDGDDISSPELIRRVASALGCSPLLIPVPPIMLMLACTILGKKAQAARLIGSLSADTSPLREELGWSPGHTMAEGLAATAGWFHDNKLL